jgi:hypothetical protein
MVFPQLKHLHRQAVAQTGIEHRHSMPATQGHMQAGDVPTPH